MNHQKFRAVAFIAPVLMVSACVPRTVVTAPDKTAPVLTEVTPVPNTRDTTPDYTFSSSEAGSISYGGDCPSNTIAAIKGNNTITFSTLPVATHSNCTIVVTDAAGNASETLAVNSFRIVQAKPLNDTGITACGDYAYSPGSGTHNNNVVCANVGATQTTAGIDGSGDPVPAGQDALYGRDAKPSTNDDSDGHKGFSFTKLSSIDGSALATQNGTWSDTGSEAVGTKWGCVQDNVTGLMWEVKTNDGGLRDKDWTYTWYSTDSATNGGDWGIGDTGANSTTGFQFTAGTYAGSDNCLNNTRCDTTKYVADVNTATLCGASDWRLPSVTELKTLRNLSVFLAVETSFFPNTISSAYWSASPFSSSGSSAWVVSFRGGQDDNADKNKSGYLRLVRDGQ